jgi:acyl-CoA reductase-like NAD-dependent aldehyde dehydrogenase
VIAVENPATGEPVGSVPVLGPAELARMAARAREAQPQWAAIGNAGRARIMRRAQKWMLDHADAVIDSVVAESGKTHEDAQLADLGYTVTALGFWAKEAARYLADERVPSWNNPLAAGKKLVIHYEPVGLVGVIGPWNYPIANSFGDCIPALMAGNAVILKPSEVTPLSSLLMAEMMRECGLPEDVFQVATGDGPTGAALIAQVDCVMFTGSSTTGRAVMRAAADALVPCYLELGGKDPMIVCADADIERAANAAAFYSMNNGGQVCISVERCYVRGTRLRRVREPGDRNGAGAAPGRADRGGERRRRRGRVRAPAEDHRRSRARRGRQGRPGADRWPRAFRARPLLRAYGARRRRPHNALHARGDVRADAADHEDRQPRTGGNARQRLRLRPAGEHLDA